MGRRRKGRVLDGILLLDKPTGLTSNQALQQAKRAFNAQKAGHTGSLDPLATGLLPLCFGNATKISAYLLDADKTYEAELNFGSTTTTGDAEGELTGEFATEHLTTALIDAALLEFVGESQQIPPMYSALKRDGQPLYKLARQGIEVPRASRDVTIYELTRLYFENRKLGISVRCSKGTYIRTLAEDIAKTLNCGAHLSRLRRTSLGPYSIEDAVETQAINATDCANGEEDGLLVSIDSALTHLPAVSLTPDGAEFVTRGNPVQITERGASGMVRMYGPPRGFLGIGEIIGDGRVTPRRIMCESA